MAHKIIWTDTARNDYLKIIDYLIESWDKKTSRIFESSVNKKLKLIAKMPKMYPVTEARESLRRCIVARQVSMYYFEAELENEITIIRFYDNRQNPDGLLNILDENIDR